MSAAEDQKPILIAGPTASGKSALAQAIAEKLNGVIINADSMQVYRELEILSARPSAAEDARIPHKLFGFVPARVAYSAGRFARDAAQAIANARAAGLRPVIVGGTGLYFEALLEGLSPVPVIYEDVRAHWRREAGWRGAGELHTELERRDPVMAARLAPTDTQRIVRALEVLESTGRSLADWQNERDLPVIDEARTVRLRVLMDRTELNTRIDCRFDRMVEAGALEEAQRLSDLGLDPGLPAMRAIGVRPLISVIRGEQALDAGVAAAKLESRQYAKRQETWLNGHMISWQGIFAKEMESNMRKIFAFIHQQR